MIMYVYQPTRHEFIILCNELLIKLYMVRTFCKYVRRCMFTALPTTVKVNPVRLDTTVESGNSPFKEINAR